MSSHRFYQVLADVKAQTCATDGSSYVSFESHEFAKQQRDVRRRNTWPGILYADTDLRMIMWSLRTGMLERCMNLYRSMEWSILESIGQQIAQDLAYMLGVGINQQILGNIKMHRMILSLLRIKLVKKFMLCKSTYL